jgi:1,5-anhydro-D-fructose reductase (1,5-anhydro-D-mannitol-forming)
LETIPKTIRWGFIGCGSVTEVKSGPAFRKVEGFDVAAVMRRDLSKAEDYAKRHGIGKFYNNAGQLIHDPEVDAVYIATPPDTHKNYALQVADAGKPCCIEKPMAPNYSDCVEIISAFEQQAIPLFVAYYRRSLPRFNQVKQWLKNGDIGSVKHVSWHLVRPPYSRDFEPAYVWRTDPEIAYGGYFDDLGSHGIDLITYLLGEISHASGHSTNQHHLYSAQDAVTGSWLHKSGVTGCGYWNFGCFSDEDKVSIFGSEGKIEFSMFKNEPLRLINDSGNFDVMIEHPENIQFFHIKAMRDHLAGLSEHPSTGISACHTSWVMDKILGKL